MLKKQSKKSRRAAEVFSYAYSYTVAFESEPPPVKQTDEKEKLRHAGPVPVGIRYNKLRKNEKGTAIRFTRIILRQCLLLFFRS